MLPKRASFSGVLLACVLAVGVLSLRQPGFLRYDARHPTP